MVTRVADLSVDEVKILIQETVTQTLLEMFRDLDPDAGLELREDFRLELQRSLRSVNVQDDTFSEEYVASLIR